MTNMTKKLSIRIVLDTDDLKKFDDIRHALSISKNATAVRVIIRKYHAMLHSTRSTVVSEGVEE